jgi:putative SOS response-associated peptidase YedK
MGELHDRMPCILAEEDWAKWLSEVPASEDELLAMLKPCSEETLKVWAVDNAIGNVKNQGRHLMLPL